MHYNIRKPETNQLAYKYIKYILIMLLYNENAYKIIQSEVMKLLKHIRIDFQFSLHFRHNDIFH